MLVVGCGIGVIRFQVAIQAGDRVVGGCEDGAVGDGAAEDVQLIGSRRIGAECHCVEVERVQFQIL